MPNFLESKPQTESIWRSVILFGRNVASYKFALGKSLLELADKETNFVSMEDLAEPFSRHISEHLKIMIIKVLPRVVGSLIRLVIITKEIAAKVISYLQRYLLDLIM